MKEQIDIFEDLLIEFDEMGFVPTTAVPDHEAYAIDWKNRLINALEGYSKQIEGEWKPIMALCNRVECNKCGEMGVLRWKYCPNCGAKMKGGAE